ncbi:MAG: topoisomerase DNA-binding C4 zinc finger domain-containing protein, partial [Lachnospiraceae bacterium]|nr:topoisomerase DNA-binding C4 zinc finger domain-containing protein [Lachnospiraceae bacterium]
GKQINIPDKLKELRAKSQRNELFCPCGCGANLVLVAGDKNLREQHFRIKDGQQFENCTVITEGKTSIDSKIVLKCWLDDNLHTDDIETRVPICDISDIERRYEFSFISRRCGIALDYCHNRANLSDEKQSILKQHSQGIKIIHVVDYMNGGSEGQYPEGLMKVQERQGFCLLLEVTDANYETAEMKAVFYGQDIDGLWQENIFADGLLREYRIDQHGEVFFKGASLENGLVEAQRRFKDANESEIKSRKEQRKQQEALAERQRIQAEEAAKKRAKSEEERRIANEKAIEERQQREEFFWRNLASNLDQQETQVRDADGNRWIKCEFCGKIAKDSEFSTYGGAIGVHLNLGTCKECSANNPAAKPRLQQEDIIIQKKAYDPSVCPECGSKLIEKNGRNGRFIGCTGFPKCKYTRSIRKM